MDAPPSTSLFCTPKLQTKQAISQHPAAGDTPSVSPLLATTSVSSLEQRPQQGHKLGKHWHHQTAASVAPHLQAAGQRHCVWTLKSLPRLLQLMAGAFAKPSLPQWPSAAQRKKREREPPCCIPQLWFPRKTSKLAGKTGSQDSSRTKCKIMHFISTVFRVRGQWEKQKSSGNSKILQRILAVNTT